MEPVTIIATALAAGAAAAARETAGAAVRDAYAGLKALIQRRFAGDAGAELALEKHATSPDVWEKPLEEALKESGAAADETILEAAQALMAEADPEGAARGKYTLTITGGSFTTFVVGEKNNVRMGGDHPRN